MEVLKIADAVEPSLREVAVLIDELSDEDVEKRAAAVRQLPRLAQELGRERTLEEVVPFLKEMLDDEDEVGLALAETLFAGPELVGVEQLHQLLPILEELMSVDDLSIRTGACDSIVSYSQKMSDSAVQEHLLPMLTRLEMHELYTKQMSACQLLGPILQRVSKADSARLCRDFLARMSDSPDGYVPAVRRTACASLGDIALHAPMDILHEVIAIFKSWAEDDCDSVRQVCAATAVKLARVLPQEGWQQHVLPMLERIVDDRHSFVRCTVSKELPNIMQLYGGALAHEILPLLLRCLTDPESEIRVLACGGFRALGSVTSEPAIYDLLFEPMRKLSRDVSDDVRARLAGSALALAPVLGTQRTVEHLLNIALLLLRDDSAEVKLAVIHALRHLAKVVTVDLLGGCLVPGIVSVTEDPNWRMRIGVLQVAPQVASYLGEQVFTSQLLPALMRLCEDRVFSVRQAAAKSMGDLAAELGSDWALAHLVPHVKALQQSLQYLVRMTAITACAEVCPHLQAQLSAVKPVVEALARDPVPNVRANAAQLAARFCGSDDQLALQLLRDLERDVDQHVAAGARQELAAIGVR